MTPQEKEGFDSMELMTRGLRALFTAQLVALNKLDVAYQAYRMEMTAGSIKMLESLKPLQEGIAQARQKVLAAEAEAQAVAALGAQAPGEEKATESELVPVVN